MTTQPDQPNENPSPVSYKPTSSSASPPLLPYFLRLWKFVAIMVLVGGTLGALPRLIAPLNYTGIAVISFPPSPLAKISAGGIAADKDIPAIPLLEGLGLVPQAGTAPEAARLIMGTRKSIGRIVDEFKFAQNWGVPRDLAIQLLTGKIIFRPGEVGDLKIEFTDPDRKLAKAVVVRLLKILKDETARIATETTGDFLTIINNGRVTAEAELLAKLTIGKEFLNKNDSVSPEQLGNTFQGVIANAMTDLIKASAVAAGKNAAVAKVRSSASAALKQNMDPNVQGNVPTVLGGLYDRKVGLTSQLSLLKQQYNDDFPEVVTVQRQLNEVTKQLNLEVLRLMKSVQSGDNPYIAPVVVESVASTAAQAVLDKALKDLMLKVKALPERGVKYAFIQADVDTATAKVKFWREQEMKAQVVIASRGHSFTEIESPDVPERPNPRGAFLGFAMGAALGLFFGSFRPYIQWYKSLPKDESA